MPMVIDFFKVDGLKSLINFEFLETKNKHFTIKMILKNYQPHPTSLTPSRYQYNNNLMFQIS